MEGAEGAVTAFAPVCYINPGFYAEYYDEPDLSGYLVTRVDQHINSENFASFPPSGIDSDTFSVRWTGQIFAGITGTYTFYVNVDDGVRVYVDDTLIIDQWADAFPVEWSGSIELDGLDHYPIVVEYYDNTGTEAIRLEWHMAGSPNRQIVNGSYYSVSSGGSGDGLYAEYYPLDLTGNPADMISRIDPEVDFKWGAASPHPSIPADRFIVRWTGQIEPIFSEIYSFYTVSDDGVRLWINGENLIDNWQDQPATQNSSNPIPLQAGQRYDIVVEYYENEGDAVVQLQWESQSQPREVVRQSVLYPTTGASGLPLPAFPAPGQYLLYRIVPVSKERLETIGIQEGVDNLSSEPYRYVIGRVFEEFVRGQLGLNFTRTMYSPSRDQATIGMLNHKDTVRPDGLTTVELVDTSTGEITSYAESAVWEVKAANCAILALDYPPDRPYQILGLIEAASLSPLGDAQIEGGPPLLRFITTSDPVFGVDVIQEANNRGVSLWQSLVYEIEGTSPPLLFVGSFHVANATSVSIENYISFRTPPFTPQRLITYTNIGGTPPTEPDDPDPEEAEECQ